MADRDIAKIFTHGRSQAVRLPKAFRLPGTEVRVSHVGRGVLLEPIESSPEEIKALLAKLKQLAKTHGPFMPEGREQPPMPPDDDIDPIDDDLP